MSGVLYVVSTPIGNLKDISQRALDILAEADFVASEDTRHTRYLLNHFSINTKLVSYHEWNEEKRCEEFMHQVSMGKIVALVTDAGTPCISDPGFRIVRRFKKNGLEVKTVPGPNAAISALSISGLPTDSFYFEGFLPKKKGRRSRFELLKTLDCSIILFESPHRIHKTLFDIHEFMGNRYVSVCRELTKKFEEVDTKLISELIIKYQNKSAKGEFVIIIAKNGFEL